MWSLRNKSNSILAQKWHLFNHNHIRLVPVTSLVLIIVMMMMVSCASAQIKYPSETDKLVAQDSNTLLSPGFLPFLNECSSKNPPVQLCTMYYDMVYNAYQLGSMGNDTKLAIQKADQELDKPELIKEFCEIFRNETINTLDKQPFSQANDFNITQWIQIRPVCEVSCLQVSSNKPQPVEVKQVCKFISGGCRWISQQKKKLYLPNLLPQIPIPVPNQSGNGNYQPVDGKTQNLNGNEENKQQLKGSISASPVSNPNTMQNPPPNLLASNLNVKSSSSSNPALSKANSNLKTPDDTHVSKQIEISPPAAQQPSAQMPGNVTPPLNKTSPSNTIANKTGISNNIETKPVNAPLPPPPAPPKQTPPSLDNQSEDEAIDGDKKNELEDENQDNEDDTEEENHNDEQDVPLENNNNNIDMNNMHNTQSRLLANQVEFREDKESSFFPYFMFLMFVVVTFYVAYHNKSKILALLIEGRRSRSYSSRGGSRRKQHSAEYRKLDSNLEEAIQSDGGHGVMSTQIIY